MNLTNDLASVIPCSGQYSFKKDMRLSAWALVAALTLVLTNYLVGHYPEMGPYGLMALRLTPLIPFGLWLRDIMRFTRGLDELQRHLQLKVWLFAALGTVVAETAVNVLNDNGAQIESVGVAGAICFMVVFWGVGSVISIRRFR